MYTQPITQQIRWQDLIVRNEVDIVLDIAQQEGWEECEIFGYGDMITQPQEANGWKLIPADLYQYTIPTVGISRVHRLLNAGVQIQGVIIADDERDAKPPPEPARKKINLAPVGAFLETVARVLLGLVIIAGAIALIISIAWPLIILAPLFLLGLRAGPVTSVDYDPKLVILVDDGNGGTVWVSLLTWYD